MSKHIFECIDAHTCGNPVRLILTEKPDLEGISMSEKRLDFLKKFDWIRKSLMFEPRGHDMMSGGMIFPHTILKMILLFYSWKHLDVYQCVVMVQLE